MTIEGRGDIVSVLVDRPDILFFASGVSNSKETNEAEYQREKSLLLRQAPLLRENRAKRLVYFGSLSIFYGDTRYVRHKMEMEQLVRENFPKYCIVRLGNIAWGDNPHTLINALRERLVRQEPMEIQDVYRYVVEKDEFLHWISLIPNFNCEINVPGTRMKVKEIVKKYVL